MCSMMKYSSHIVAWHCLVGFLVMLLLHKLAGLIIRRSKRLRVIRELAPQPRGALPLIGHMRLLKDKTRPLTHTLGELADEYGPVFLLRLGCRMTVIVSGVDAVRECFTTNDEVFATRPINPAGRIMGYDFGMMGFAPYGAYWRGIRKMATVELLSKSKLGLLKDVRTAEIGVCFQELYRLWEENDKRSYVVDMKKWMGHVTFNVVVKIVAGKRYFCSGGTGFSEEGWVFRRAISRFFTLMKTIVVSDMLPYLRWFDFVFGGHDSAMRQAFLDIDQVVSNWLEQHKKRKLLHTDEEPDFMDTILSILPNTDVVNMRDPDTIVKAISMSLILGSTDTTTNSLTLTLACFLNHPDVMAKIRHELDTIVGRNRVVDESDVKNLPYLQAAVKESFRLHPTSQFLQPHEAIQDCRLAGFHIPAGTRLLVNNWKLHRDPNTWGPDSLEFRPERFLTTHAHVDVRGHQHELVPFGSGRRSCPGIGFALHVMHLTLARLVHEFDMTTPSGRKVEMSAGLGSTLDSTPLNVRLSPRLPFAGRGPNKGPRQKPT